MASEDITRACLTWPRAVIDLYHGFSPHNTCFWIRVTGTHKHTLKPCTRAHLAWQIVGVKWAVLSIWFPAVGEQKRQSWRVEESSRETNCHHRGGEKAGRTEWWWGAKRERKRVRELERELEVESMEREEGERLVGTSESLKCTVERERATERRWEVGVQGCKSAREWQPGRGPLTLSPGDQSAVGTRANQPKTVASPPQFSPFSLWKPSPVLSTLYLQLLFYSLSFSFIILDGLSYPLAFNDSSLSSFLVFSHNWTIHTCTHAHTHTYKNTQMCDHSVFITMKSANNEIPGGLMVLIGGHPVKNPTPPSLPSASMHRHIPLQWKLVWNR